MLVSHMKQVLFNRNTIPFLQTIDTLRKNPDESPVDVNTKIQQALLQKRRPISCAEILSLCIQGHRQLGDDSKKV
jgi:hypothetical protein